MKSRILNFQRWNRLNEGAEGHLNRDRIEELVKTELGTDRIWWQDLRGTDPDSKEVMLIVSGIDLPRKDEIIDTGLNLVFKEIKVEIEDPFDGIFPYPKNQLIMTRGVFQYTDTWVPIQDPARSDWRDSHWPDGVMVELEWKGGQIEDDLGLIRLLRSEKDAGLYFEDNWHYTDINWEGFASGDWEVVTCDKM